MKKRMIIAVLSAVLVFAAITSCGNAAERPLTIAELLNLGEKYLLELDYEQALAHFLRIIDIDPMIPRGYTGAAEAYVGLGRIHDALGILEQGLLMLPDNNEIMAALLALNPPQSDPQEEDAASVHPENPPEPEPPEATHTAPAAGDNHSATSAHGDSVSILSIEYSRVDDAADDRLGSQISHENAIEVRVVIEYNAVTGERIDVNVPSPGFSGSIYGHYFIGAGPHAGSDEIIAVLDETNYDEVPVVYARIWDGSEKIAESWMSFPVWPPDAAADAETPPPATSQPSYEPPAVPTSTPEPTPLPLPTPNFTPEPTPSIPESVGPYPVFPSIDRSHYVIYREGFRGNRIEVSFFDIIDMEDIHHVYWIRTLEINYNTLYTNDIKYYLDGETWVYFESDYSRISDYATDVLASSLNVLDRFGNILLYGGNNP